MFSLPQFLSALSRIEKILLTGLFAAVCLSLGLLLRSFYLDMSVELPKVGGTYIEGSVGEIHPMNPWFTVTNDVTRDIVSLVFAGLQKYDPQTGEIINDLAELDISADGRIYTATLKENLFWHDSTPENPHPVTADDVVFTFNMIQEDDFPNTLLKQNFRGVTIEKISDRAVQFRLEKPYAFFSSNLTLGLLPKRSFEGVPAGRLDQALDFAFFPIGAGPYAFVSFLQTDLSTEVTLQRFEKFPDSDYKFERIVFRVFPEYSLLLSDIANLDAVRLVPRNEKGEPILPRGFKAIHYTLPQYVALFFNLDRTVTQDKALRLGLQLATDKQAIVDGIRESQIVDTPLLEIDLGDWRYQFDKSSAQGALFNSDWHLPEKIRLQRLQERREANVTGTLQFLDQVVYLEDGASLTLTGSIAGLTLPASVNGLPVTQGDGTRTGSGTWFVKLGTGQGSGTLAVGLNRIRLVDKNGRVVDTAFVERVMERKEYERALGEQELLQRYEASKDGTIPENERIAVESLYEEEGYLRLRKDSDPPSIRKNLAGQELSLTLVTSPAPIEYKEIAEMVKQQWRSVGVNVNVEIPETRQEFEERMLTRNYDVLLFGQSLLDNLDSYPYWHSSQIQDMSGERSKLKLDAFNLSQYASFASDSLLTRIRETRNAQTRETALKELNDLLKQDVPAIFLYSPLYMYGYREDVKGVEIGKLALHSDRLLSMDRWFIQTERHFKDGKSWLSFFGWLPSLLK